MKALGYQKSLCETEPLCFFRWKLSDASSGRKRALLIGINQYYPDNTIGNLQYCVNDVVELNKILSDKLKGNFDTQLLHSEMAEIKSHPTRSNIMALTKLLSSNSTSNDTILFYFAGHGFEQRRVNYLLPADARRNVLSETAIQLKWIKETLSKSLARKKIMIIDACHAGSELGRAQSIPMTKSFQEEMFAEAEGFAILSSCKIGQLSNDYEEKKHGAFSFFMLEGLRGKADSNADRVITVPDVNNYVSGKMREWSLEKELQQNPVFYYNVSGDFVFVKVPLEESKGLPSELAYPSVERIQDDEILAKILEDASFMSWEDADSGQKLFDDLKGFLSSGDKTTKGKKFLRKLSETRFSDPSVKELFMPIVADVIQSKDIKKWLRNETRIRQFLVLEFTTSGSFDYAGMMARIVCSILPVLSDSELLEIVDAVEQNDQISSSFKARGDLWSIINSAKSVLPIDRYREIVRRLFG